MTTIPTCPVCGSEYPGHSAEACLEQVTRQRDNAIRELERALWHKELAERKMAGWRWLVWFFWRKRKA